MNREGERESDGAEAGAGPSSLAAVKAKNGTGRDRGSCAAEGGPRAHPGVQQQEEEQLRQRRVIRWERFLPRRSLRVLLVEQDDSTRHIVTALLRKCSYRVAAVADGLKAWDVLKEKNYNFDLVLSEVEVPTLSGISLLCKIMANELSKNIPVIMMSSHYSVSVVFRCMQKGAVDFLVKPVRKNELRNLWQHVWRRHCSTSFGNVRENMPNNQTASENMSDNHAASNDVSANAGKESGTGESSDGDDDQSSGSKPPLTQNESSKKQGVFILVGDRNSAGVMKSQSHQLCDDVATLDKSVGVEVTLSVQEITTSEKVQEQIHFCDTPLCKGKDLGYARQNECEDADLRPFGQTAMPYKSLEGTIDFIGSVADGHHSFSPIDNDSEGEKALCKTKRSSNLINTCTADSSPSWELSLMRPQLNGSVKNGLQEKNILNHSVASAFSRYPHTGIYLPGQKSGSSSATIYIRTRESSERCQLQFNSHDTTNERSASFIPDGRLESSRRNKEDAIVCHRISSCNDEDAELPDSVPSGEGMSIGYSASKDTVAFPQSKLGMLPLPIHVGAVPFRSVCADYGPILQPMFYHEPSVPPQSSTVIVQPKCLTYSDQPVDYGNQRVADIQSTAYHNCVENHHSCHLELGKKDNPVDTEQSDPSKPRLHTGGSMEHNDQCGSCSQDIINGIGSNGSGGTADAAVNTSTAFDYTNGSELHHYREKCMDHHRSHREAALIKFRLKRKDRCFEKKVRYHSRKMLAQQRPRVKGQFVRQAIVDSNTTATEVDD